MLTLQNKSVNFCQCFTGVLSPFLSSDTTVDHELKVPSLNSLCTSDHQAPEQNGGSWRYCTRTRAFHQFAFFSQPESLHTAQGWRFCAVALDILLVYGMYAWWYTTLGSWNFDIFLSCVTSPPWVLSPMDLDMFPDSISFESVSRPEMSYPRERVLY